MSTLRSIVGFLGDGALLLLVIFLFPLAILLVGTPIAFVVRAALEVARRFS